MRGFLIKNVKNVFEMQFDVKRLLFLNYKLQVLINKLETAGSFLATNGSSVMKIDKETEEEEEEK